MTKTLVLPMLLGVGLGQPAAGQTRPLTPAPQITATSPQLEDRDQPVTAADVAILVRAQALLSSNAVWNRADERECKEDPGSGASSARCRRPASTCLAATTIGEWLCRKSASLSRTPLEDAILRIAFVISTTFRKRSWMTSSESWPSRSNASQRA
jgi:hypothetical protein